MWQIYERPDSIEQALTLLAEYDGRAQVIAGGTDLIIELQEGEHSVECLVDVTRIPGLDRIERQNGWIVLGANVSPSVSSKSRPSSRTRRGSWPKRRGRWERRGRWVPFRFRRWPPWRATWSAPCRPPTAAWP